MKVVLIIVGVLAALYVVLCAVLYFKQEKLLFFPSRLPADYRFRFLGNFEERWFTMADGTRLHGLLFHALHSKGLVFYLHGNGGDVSSWADAAPVYTHLGYDVFFLDYRGYGKSEGLITSQVQLLSDVQTAYPFVPGFLVRYPLPTNELITQVKAPVVLFHGDRDEVIYYQSSVRLKALLKPTDRLVLLPGAGHNGMTDNPAYQRELAALL